MLYAIRCANINEVIKTFRENCVDLTKERYFIAGPCGIGKSSLGRELSRKLDLPVIDHDEMKEKINFSPNPCWVSSLDIGECLKESLNARENPNSYIFVAGGGSVFNATVDNQRRLEQTLRIKKEYGLTIVMLVATRHITESRYLKMGVRDRAVFKETWNNWLEFEKPFWEFCADCIIDTSGFVLTVKP